MSWVTKMLGLDRRDAEIEALRQALERERSKRRGLDVRERARRRRQREQQIEQLRQSMDDLKRLVAAGVAGPRTEDQKLALMPVEVQRAINDIAFEEGPLRRHLIKVADRELSDPNTKPEALAEIIRNGEEATL